MENLNSRRGRIFDIQRFSIHDGPGIRTIVFLKGCAFRCRWCCNPESQAYEIENMKDDNGKITQVGRDVTVEEVLKTVERDRGYYRRSGGGLTLSGGEFLCQPDFSYALLKGAREIGINTAVETTSFAELSVIERVLPYIDTYLMDIKHMNPKKHLEFVGKSNEVPLKNAREIAKKAKKLIIRVPVIPGFNDTPEEIYDIAKFASSLEGVEEIHLLPYHRLGQDKYRFLGRSYYYNGVEPLGDEKMNMLLKSAESVGIRAQIGG